MLEIAVNQYEKTLLFYSGLAGGYKTSSNKNADNAWFPFSVVARYRFPSVVLTVRGFRINCKYTHTTTTRSAPGQNVNSRKIKAINKIAELSRPMLNTLQ